jgi:hypothetical protein
MSGVLPSMASLGTRSCMAQQNQTTSEGAKTRYSKKSEKIFLKIRCLLQNPEHFSLQVLEKS